MAKIDPRIKLAACISVEKKLLAYMAREKRSFNYGALWSLLNKIRRTGKSLANHPAVNKTLKVLHSPEASFPLGAGFGAGSMHIGKQLYDQYSQPKITYYGKESAEKRSFPFLGQAMKGLGLVPPRPAQGTPISGQQPSFGRSVANFGRNFAEAVQYIPGMPNFGPFLKSRGVLPGPGQSTGSSQPYLGRAMGNAMQPKMQPMPQQRLPRQY